MRPHYLVFPGDVLDVEIVQADGARVLVRGRIDAVPETCTAGRGLSQALSVRLVALTIRPLLPPPADAVVVAPLRLVPSTD